MNSTENPPPPSEAFIGIITVNLLMAFFYYDPYCPASLHISFLLTSSNHFLTMIFLCLQESSILSQQVRNKLSPIYDVLSGPVALGITILGVIRWFLYIIACEKLLVWWEIYKDGPLDTVPYHPNRDSQHELEMEEISAGLLQAEASRNTMREKTCSICYVDFEIGEKVVDVPNCLHTFHEECIAAWMERSYTCPMCRGSVRKTGQRPRENHNAQQDLENGA